MSGRGPRGGTANLDVLRSVPHHHIIHQSLLAASLRNGMSHVDPPTSSFFTWTGQLFLDPRRPALLLEGICRPRGTDDRDNWAGGSRRFRAAAAISIIPNFTPVQPVDLYLSLPLSFFLYLSMYLAANQGPAELTRQSLHLVIVRPG